MGKIIKTILIVFLVLAIMLTVSLAIAATVCNELLLVYQSSIVSAHLLLITILVCNVLDLDTQSIKGDDK